jgi:ATP-dependent helicase/nuclease subunit A
LTFTDAAAEQMRERIAEQLRLAAGESGDSHLRQQLILLQGADISTIHSFCKRLITEFFYKLGLDPTFRVIDADEQVLLKAEALEKTIDWAWQQSNLSAGLGQLLARRDLRANDGFLSKIIAVSDFLDTVALRESWYERAQLLAEAIDPFATELGERQKQIVGKKLEEIAGQLRHAQKLCKKEDAGNDWIGYCEDTFVKPVGTSIALLRSGDWEKCAEAIKEYAKPRVSKPKEICDLAAELIQKTVKSAVDEFEELRELAILNPEYLDKISGAASVQTKVLIELVRKFGELYDEAKKRINSLDFADLEHYALRLLTVEGKGRGELVPSETAPAMRQRYRYIFVDEYQDVNPVQQAILKAISGEDNVFVVGDVKQSIYAFRGAEPGIFTEKLKSASVDPRKAAGGLRVDLTANWRSAKGILDFVNLLFGRIMRGSFAGIEYDESARLRPGDEEAAEAKSPVVELHILDKDAGAGRYSSRQCQAALIAQRIKQMVGTETGKPEIEIYDKQLGRKRPVRYGDIVVLMRSPAKRVNDYVEILRLAGVPVKTEHGAGYFENTEIRDCLCMLKVLDNPQRNIELAAVLRSPFFNVTDSELAKIKMHGQAGGRDFYACVSDYCESGPDGKLANKIRDALEQIDQWRTEARRGQIADLLWRIYRRTGYLSFVSAIPNGRTRRANLLKLHERAIQFEGFASTRTVTSLSRLVEFIEKLEETGQEWTSAEPEAEAEDAVGIISVHKSKGLEFPVVFLAELDSNFNMKDLRSDCLADAGAALGLQIIDRRSRSRLSSMAHQVIAEQKRSTMLAEEMRILYVAMTRARERLVLSASEKQKHCRDIVCSGFYSGDDAIADWQLGRCKSSLEWLLYGLSNQSCVHEAFETEMAEKCEDDGLFDTKVYRQAELDEFEKFIQQLKDKKSTATKLRPKTSRAAEKKSEFLSAVKKSLLWRYRFAGASILAAKQSVTELTHREDEYIKFDYSRTLSRKPKAALIVEPTAGEPLDARLIGSATHLVISELDLSVPVDEEAVEQTIKRLLSKQAITEAAAQRIDTGSIVRFFESELGRQAIEALPCVWREWVFTFGLGADALYAMTNDGRGMKDEVIVVQGIIDMLVGTPAGLLVIDFKTDDVAAEQIAERANLYRRQLELYGRAAEAILKQKIAGRWLYFLKPGCAVEV